MPLTMSFVKVPYTTPGGLSLYGFHAMASHDCSPVLAVAAPTVVKKIPATDGATVPKPGVVTTMLLSTNLIAAYCVCATSTIWAGVPQNPPFAPDAPLPIVLPFPPAPMFGSEPVPQVLMPLPSVAKFASYHAPPDLLYRLAIMVVKLASAAKEFGKLFSPSAPH